MVRVLVAGGVKTIEIGKETLENDTPLVIVDKSGGTCIKMVDVVNKEIDKEARAAAGDESNADRGSTSGQDEDNDIKEFKNLVESKLKEGLVTVLKEDPKKKVDQMILKAVIAGRTCTFEELNRTTHNTDLSYSN